MGTKKSSGSDRPGRAAQHRLAAATVLPQRYVATALEIQPTYMPAPSPRGKGAGGLGSARGKLTVRARFGELRTALSDGWEIVQPIFARPLWSVPDDSTTAFSFVLRRERDTRLVTVPEGRSIQRFIRDRHLSVDYRR